MGTGGGKRCDNASEDPRWFQILFATALINFFAFWVIGLVNGGSAIGGKIEGDKYFVVNHGKYTQVSKTFFYYSRVHTISVFITHPLAIGCAFWLHMMKRKS